MNPYSELIKAIDSPKAAAPVSGNRKEELRKTGDKQITNDMLLTTRDAETYCKGGITLTASGRVNAFVLGYFLQYHPWAGAYMGVSKEEAVYLAETYVKVNDIANRVFNNAPQVVKQTLSQKLYAYVNANI